MQPDPAALSLADELAAVRARSIASLEPHLWQGLADVIKQLRMLQIAEHSLAAGESFPDFILPNTTGTLFRSDELLQRGPLVIAFFRGGWCPYCERTLLALEAVRPAIQATGATLLGVAPSKRQELAKVAGEKGLGFPLLSDVDGRLARLCGLLYSMRPAQLAYYRDRCGLDLAAINAGSTWEVPVPATYVVDRNATIIHAWADPDWARRTEPATLLAEAEALRMIDNPA